MFHKSIEVQLQSFKPEDDKIIIGEPEGDLCITIDLYVWNHT
jgi:hypothetical protein